jgi:hypothetical protein
MNSQQVQLFAQITANMETLRQSMQALADSLVNSEMDAVIAKFTDYDRQCYNAMATSEAAVGKTRGEIYLMTKARHAFDERFESSLPQEDDQESLPSQIEADHISIEEVHTPFSAEVAVKPKKIRPDYNHPLWPSPRPRIYAQKCQKMYHNFFDPKIRFTHETAIQYLADRAKITVDAFLKMQPEEYNRKFICASGRPLHLSEY